MKTHENGYILEWIDLLVSQILNPLTEEFESLTAEWLRAIYPRIKQESRRLQLLITQQVFSAKKPARRDFIVQRYHSTLTLLLSQLIHYQYDEQFKHRDLKDILARLQQCIQDVLYYIENRYAAHLSHEEQISALHFESLQLEFAKDISYLKAKFLGYSHPALKVVFKILDRFIAAAYEDHKVTYRAVSYKKALIKGLKELQFNSMQDGQLPEIDRLLIYLNFNSKTYISHLITSFSEKITTLNHSEDGIRALRFHFKTFRQIQPKPGLKFNPLYYDIDTVVSNWFQQELDFYKEFTHHSPLLQTPRVDSDVSRPAAPRAKILCNLSTDQIALILRSADEAKVLQARSLNEIFKTIVPFLSTPRKEELSSHGVRSRMYNVEENDKTIAIDALERMIEKIRSY